MKAIATFRTDALGFWIGLSLLTLAATELALLAHARAPQFVFTNLAGLPLGRGASDGAGAGARFYTPFGVAVDRANNIYVADTYNSTVRKVTAAGVVTTVAGSPGQPGSGNGLAHGSARFFHPGSVAVDSTGNLYVADSDNQTIRKISWDPPAGLVSTLAGSPNKSGSADGVGPAARFSSPYGIAADAAGNLYVGDSGNHTIRKVKPSGEVTTLAGRPGVSGNADGFADTATFWQPTGIAVDAAGNVYVADSLSHTIRKVTATGVVTTLAGSARSAGSADGFGSAARFNEPFGIAVDFGGNVYVADSANHSIRKVTPAGLVSTIAGRLGQAGALDGVGGSARFSYPYGVAVDSAGNLYVADTLNDRITIGRLIDYSPPIITSQPQTEAVRAGDPATFRVAAVGTIPLTYQWRRNGANLLGATNDTLSLTNVQRGNGGAYSVFVTNSAGSATSSNAMLVVLITPPVITQQPRSQIAIVGDAVVLVVNVSGSGPLAFQWSKNGRAIPGATNSTLAFAHTQAADAGQYSVAVSNAFGAATSQTAILGISPKPAQFAFTNLAGLPGIAGSLNGAGHNARFGRPYGLAVDADGNVYTADTFNHIIRKVTPDGVVSTLAGVAGRSGIYDGAGSQALFNSPSAVAVDPAGNVYVADTQNDTIRMVTPAGVVSTLAGTPGRPGSSDGPAKAGPETGAVAAFHNPYGIAVDAAVNIYVADTLNSSIRKISPAGMVTTLAGSPTSSTGAADGIDSAATFSLPYGIAADSVGNVYVADTGNHTIRKVTPTGVVTTLAGSPGERGSADDTGAAARFDQPWGLAIDGAGNLYVADSFDSTIRKVTPAGIVTTLAGSPGISGSADGADGGARFNTPTAVAIDHSGNLYVADSGNHRITKGIPLFTSSGPRLSVVQVLGNQFTIQFPSATGFTYGWLHKTNLSEPAWTVLTNWPGTGATIEITQPIGPAASGFFQLKAQ